MPQFQLFADQPTPETFLSGIYKQYEGKDAKGVDYSSPDKFGQYFDEAMTQLFVKDQKEAGEDIGRLDFDPFVNAQDFELSAIQVKVSDSATGSAKVTVTFNNTGKQTASIFDLSMTKSGWRITDIHWQDSKKGLKDILSTAKETK